MFSLFLVLKHASLQEHTQYTLLDVFLCRQLQLSVPQLIIVPLRFAATPHDILGRGSGGRPDVIGTGMPSLISYPTCVMSHLGGDFWADYFARIVCRWARIMWTKRVFSVGSRGMSLRSLPDFLVCAYIRYLTSPV